jgi:hypothetical protein
MRNRYGLGGVRRRAEDGVAQADGSVRGEHGPEFELALDSGLEGVVPGSILPLRSPDPLLASNGPIRTRRNATAGREAQGWPALRLARRYAMSGRG